MGYASNELPAPAMGAMRGKVCVVTGGSAGIGTQTALGLARLGATVTIVGRDPLATAAAVGEIRSRSGNARVEALLADFSSQAAVRRLAAEVARRHECVDVLINNAGTTRTRREVTEDGIELQFAVNHLAPYLLTRLLLPLLRASAAARVVTVSSDIHRRAAIDFADLQGERRYSGSRAYARSKLANVLFTYELARRLEGTTATVNCLHPGIIAGSSFGRNYPGYIQPALRLLAALPLPFITSVEDGATTSLYLASSPEVATVTGRYFVKCRPVRSAAATYDRAAQGRLWEVSARLTGLPPDLDLDTAVEPPAAQRSAQRDDAARLTTRPHP